MGHEPIDEGGAPSRSDIALSWKRSSMSGLRPSSGVAHLPVADIDRRGRLMTAATPVLDRLAQELADTGYSLLLADRQAQLTDVRVGRSGLRARLERDGAVLGGRWLEETTGTNSIATSHELRRGVTVRGEEHYLEALKKYTCYGRPVLSPVHRRLEGVVDVTCLATDDHPLLGPLLDRAVREIEDRLGDGAGLADQRLLAAFQLATASAASARTTPVLALGDNLLLATPQAMELLDTADHATLRALAEDTRADSDSTRSCAFEPAHGGPVLLRWRKLPEWGGGAVFELGEAASAGPRGGPSGRSAQPADPVRSAEPARRADPVRPTDAARPTEPDRPARSAEPGRTAARLGPVVPEPQASRLRQLAREGSAVLIGGEPGTGHDTALTLLSGTERVVRFHADEGGEGDEPCSPAEAVPALADEPGPYPTAAESDPHTTARRPPATASESEPSATEPEPLASATDHQPLAPATAPATNPEPPRLADRFSALATALRDTDTLVVLEGIHLLTAREAHRIGRVLRTTPPAARLAMTSGPPHELRGEHLALAAHCAARVELLPLRARRTDIPALIRHLLVQLDADPSSRFTRGALDALTGQPWPGNLTELESVVRACLRRRRVGDITLRDLPDSHSGSSRCHRFTPLEQAECDVIRRELAAVNGNKRLAAQRLGISRTTLYQRIRALGIL
ncbi:sigma-54-dependent Fis family transcriptional regulator [Streptomyces sp. NPDC056716]|uniref:sigma-54-dependent Fis family transcriptional regulator n=1 Tax=unclassified Streptomyces TaxID=2593676 RepID=UPI0036C659BE